MIGDEIIREEVLEIDGAIETVKKGTVSTTELIELQYTKMMQEIMKFAEYAGFMIDIDDHGNDNANIENIHLQIKNKMLLVY